MDNDFGNYSAGRGSRTPIDIINHMSQVLSSTRVFITEERYEKVLPEKLDLKFEIERFNSELKNIDINYSKRLLQGPFSDILTHIGQISMLSRLNNNPIEEEDFSSANIKTGIF